MFVAVKNNLAFTATALVVVLHHLDVCSVFSEKEVMHYVSVQVELTNSPASSSGTVFVSAFGASVMRK